MSLILELPPDLETELAAEAAQLQLPISEYALRLLAAGRSTDPKPKNGAELVAYWQRAGLVGTRLDITDASQHARNIRHQAQQRESS